MDLLLLLLFIILHLTDLPSQREQFFSQKFVFRFQVIAGIVVVDSNTGGCHFILNNLFESPPFHMSFSLEC